MDVIVGLVLGIVGLIVVSTTFYAKRNDLSISSVLPQRHFWGYAATGRRRPLRRVPLCQKTPPRLTVRKTNKSRVVAGLFRPCGSLAPPNGESLLRRPGAHVRVLVWPGWMHKAQTLSQPGFLELKKKTVRYINKNRFYHSSWL